MSRQPDPRFPFEPLLRAASEDQLSTVAARVGVSARSLYRYRRDGVPMATADRIACALGVYGPDLWPDWWTVEIPEPKRELRIER